MRCARSAPTACASSCPTSTGCSAARSSRPGSSRAAAAPASPTSSTASRAPTRSSRTRPSPPTTPAGRTSWRCPTGPRCGLFRGSAGSRPSSATRRRRRASRWASTRAGRCVAPAAASPRPGWRRAAASSTSSSCSARTRPAHCARDARGTWCRHRGIRRPTASCGGPTSPTSRRRCIAISPRTAWRSRRCRPSSGTGCSRSPSRRSHRWRRPTPPRASSSGARSSRDGTGSSPPSWPSGT